MNNMPFKLLRGMEIYSMFNLKTVTELYFGWYVGMQSSYLYDMITLT